MNSDKLHHYKAKLEREEERLLGELKELGRVNPTNPNDWEPTYSNLNAAFGASEIAPEADPIDQADLFEEYETRVATEGPLEAQLLYVKRALKRIQDGTYGWCTKGEEKHEIEEARLEASPIALTCIAHLKK